MPFLFDGYNVYHVACKISSDLVNITPAGLCRLIEGDMMRLGDIATVMFDGGMLRGMEYEFEQLELVTVKYAGKNSDADTQIEKLIQKNTAPKRLIVVSSDRRIRQAARRRRCVSLSSNDYMLSLLARLDDPIPQAKKPGEKSLGVADGELGDWLDLFGLDVDPDEPEDPLDRIRF